MGSVEFAVPDGVAGVLQIGHDAAAGGVDRQDLIFGAVRDEDPRAAAGGGWHDEARRAGEDGGEEVAARQADRQAVGRSIGEAADGELVAVDGAAIERVVQRAIEEVDVGSEAIVDRVPRAVARFGHEQDDAPLLGRGGEERRGAARRAARPVQRDEQRRRPVRAIGLGYDQQPVARAAKIERMLAGLDRPGRRLVLRPDVAVAAALGQRGP